MNKDTESEGPIQVPRGLSVARQCAQRGWRVFPVKLTRMPTGKLDKKPHLTGWRELHSDDFCVLADWWHRWPRAAPGVLTGVETGLYVVDEDEPHTAIRYWADAGEWTWRPSRTPGHQHALFHGGGPRRSTGQDLTPGVDVKGEGSYVVAWEALPPFWSLERLPESVRRGPLKTHSSGEAVTGPVALQGAVVAISRAAEGSRNRTLNAWAWRTFSLVRAGLVSEAEWRQRLTAAALQNGSDEWKVEGVLDAIVRKVSG